jgi:heat shock protein HslJ
MKRSLSGFSCVAVGTLAILVMAVSGCGGGGAGQADDSKALEGKAWKAVQIAGVTKLETTKGRAATATFSAGRAGGSGSVNSWGGAYTTGPGNTIRISDVVTTEMAGPQNLMDQEAAYYAALPKAVTYKVMADSLILYDDKGTVLVSYEVIPPAPLAGTVWQATPLSTGGPDQAVSSDDPVITAVFSADGKLSGKSPVNQYSTTYTFTADGKMTIDPQIISTKMAGSPAAMAQEAAYLAALPKTASYSIQADQLTLSDASGAVLVQFTAQ